MSNAQFYLTLPSRKPGARLPRVTRFVASPHCQREGDGGEKGGGRSAGWQVESAVAVVGCRRGIFHGTNVASHKITMHCVPVGVFAWHGRGNMHANMQCEPKLPRSHSQLIQNSERRKKKGGKKNKKYK